MEINMTGFVFGFLFGTIGFGYMAYGKKMQDFEFIFAGLALIVFPYLIESTIWTIIIGIGLFLAPFIYKRY